MTFITIIKQYWQYIAIAILVAFIGVQKLELANNQVELAQRQAIIDTMTPIIQSNNVVIEALQQDSEELATNINEANIKNEQLRKQLGKKITEIVSMPLPDDCHKSLDITVKMLATDVSEWNNGK